MRFVIAYIISAFDINLFCNSFTSKRIVFRSTADHSRMSLFSYAYYVALTQISRRCTCLKMKFVGLAIQKLDFSLKMALVWCIIIILY